MHISITSDIETKLLRPLVKNIQRFGEAAMHTYIANFATGIMKDATIPLGTKAKSQKTGLPQGAGSINRDIHKIAGSPAKAYHILHSKGKPRQAAAIYRNLKQKNIKEANRLNTAFHSPLKLQPTINPSDHQKARKNGIVTTPTNTIITNQNKLTTYKKSIHKHTGKAKSGWLIKNKSPQGKAPKWIARHGKNAIITHHQNTYTLTNTIPYSKQTLITSQIPHVKNNAAKATNSKLNALWRKINK